uniref:Uncharacterized protein MANES_13G138100 n=1 Tax=Rhizophora mucronata TaxID=61149 RepID=A0A2P2PHY5_RHIMU
MASPANSQDLVPPNSDLSTEDQERKPEQLDEASPPPAPPQSEAKLQFPKTLEMEITDPEDAKAQDPQYEDQNLDDPEDIAPLSPTNSDPPAAAVAVSTSSRRGGGPKRKKMNRRVAALERKSQKKIEILAAALKPVPFVPNKVLDFTSHEALLKRLGLWDFVHLQFDLNIRTDLLAQLIATYNPSLRASYVNGFRIKVNRADLARALKLPAKKDKNSSVDNAREVKESEESIGFIEEVLSNWVLLHGDTWIMPTEIVNLRNAIKEGNFERVDWAGLIWSMMEKELSVGADLKECYYASHFHCLIKDQKEDLLKEEPVKMEVDVKEEENNDVRMIDEPREGLELEEHTIELSLGGMDSVVRDDEERDGKEHVDSGHAMDCEKRKEDEEEQGKLLGSCVDGAEDEEECEELGKPEEEGEEEGNEEGGEDDAEEARFNLSPKDVALEGVSSENLLSVMEAVQIPFDSGMQPRDNLSSGEFLASGIHTQTIPSVSSLLGNDNGNGNKRPIEHLENDMRSFPGVSKRIRSDVPWDMKSSSEYDLYMDQMQHLMGKARMMYEAKEQACQEMNVNQQMLISELQRRDNMIQQLHKSKCEEQQKRQVEVYRLERELYLMGNLLQEYRKALKKTQKVFAEYRSKCPLPVEPIYKDAGPGGLVLSTKELEKQRLKEEEQQNRMLIEKKVREFEAESFSKFDAHRETVDLLAKKLLDAEKSANILKETFAKQKASKISDCAAVGDELEPHLDC